MMNLEGNIQMKTLRTLLFTSFAVAISVAAAQAQQSPDVTGAWKLSVGGNVVCPLTLTADGTATFASECAAADRVARWHTCADKVELKTASGETVGILRHQGEGYTGKRFSDGKALLLSR